MSKDPAELARMCREQAEISSTAETRTALQEMADKYDRMAASRRAGQELTARVVL